jgi:sec-independent protein translocase protein TatB
MFDIGFWEMALIVVVALVVVGPRELPTLLRGVGSWVGRARGIARELKNELRREVAQADELKRLVERESEIAELHKMLDEARTRIPLDPSQDDLKGGNRAASGDDATGREAGQKPPERDRDGKPS